MASIQTVLGQVSPNLGCVLTHEHFSLNFEKFYVPPPDDIKIYFQKNIALDNVGFIRQYPYSSHYNLKFNDNDTHEAVKEDIRLYKKLKGGAIVENSSHGLDRNLELMYEISKDCGIHVIAGTGHYVQAVQNQSTLQLRVEEMTDLYAREIMTGCEINNGKNIVKCGFIGEVGSSWPITDFEKRAIQATGEIQEVIGCGVSFHPGRDTKAPFEIIRLYLEAGGKANKCVMSHLERTVQNFDDLLEFAKLGTYLQYDLFGVECSYYQLNNEVDMPSDAQRINNVMKLIAEGLEDRILLSHDIHTKHRLINFGGHGYSHLQLNIIPRLFAKGLSIEQVDKITVKNPSNWLAFNN